MRLWRGQVNHRNKIYKKTCVQYEAEQLPPFVVGTLWLSLDLGGFIRCLQIAILALAGVFWYMIRSYHLVICFSSLFMLLLTLFWPFSLLHHPQISQNVECLFMPSRLPRKKKNTTRTPSVTVLQRDRDRSCVSACWIPTFSPPPEARMIQDDEQTLDSGSDIFQRYTGIWTKTHMWENLENSL